MSWNLCEHLTEHISEHLYEHLLAYFPTMQARGALRAIIQGARECVWKGVFRKFATNCASCSCWIVRDPCQGAVSSARDNLWAPPPRRSPVVRRRAEAQRLERLIAMRHVRRGGTMGGAIDTTASCGS